MDERTRKDALQKAESITNLIAYPDELLDDKKLKELYKNLHLPSDNYLQDLLNLRLFNDEYFFSELGKPVRKNEWVSHGNSAVVNAFYSRNGNSIGKCDLV